MSSSFLEIVEMPNGDIVLQRADDDAEPMVVIQFSEESRIYLLDNTLEVARAMIQAGIQAVADLSEGVEGELDDIVEEARRILH